MTTIRLTNTKAVTLREVEMLRGGGKYEEVAVLEGRDLRRARKKLRQADRRHRRQAGKGGPRLDPHGQHRTVVRLTQIVRMRDWVDDKLWSTITAEEMEALGREHRDRIDLARRRRHNAHRHGRPGTGRPGKWSRR